MNDLFPATYSTLCSTALSTLITQKYNLGDVTCKLLVRGVGDTYLVHATTERFVFRVYRSSHRNLAQIEEEVALLLALRDSDVSVSYPIIDKSGEAIQKMNAVEGERYAVLFSYAKGEAVRILNDSQLLSFGSEMARFHNVSSSLPIGNARWQFELDTMLLKPLLLVEPGFADDPEGYTWLQQAVRRAAKKISEQDVSGWSKGYCHFDFLPKNIHFEGDSVTFFDFDFMGYGCLVNDIMSYWQHLAIHVYAGRMTQEAVDAAYAIFLEGYRKNRLISEAELAMVPYLTLGFWLFYMGFHTTHDQFHAFTLPSQVKEFTGLLRFIVDTYWGKEDLITLPADK